ncbi:hypothetical protein C5167_042250 [Papaver somniferum]|uniref:Uncharacterized protein n=1 Tax=Papaver somniferum TaxID=3469 RepID=A0A4Y7L3B7_PAPSO|nr:hypothetical protein C5167_042250 [Papaver somniferum]
MDGNRGANLRTVEEVILKVEELKYFNLSLLVTARILQFMTIGKNSTPQKHIDERRRRTRVGEMGEEKYPIEMLKFAEEQVYAKGSRFPFKLRSKR